LEENLNNFDAGKMDFWRPLKPGEVIHELVDVVEELPEPEFVPLAVKNGSPQTPASYQETPSPPIAGIPTDDRKELTDETRRIISVTVERIAREMIPAIVERVIRQEIEKLKNEIG